MNLGHRCPPQSYRLQYGSNAPPSLSPAHSHESEPQSPVYLPTLLSPGVQGVPQCQMGFWNRCGDHVYEGCVVYAPLGLMYPEEPKDHPHEDVRYRDELDLELKV